VKGLAEIVYHEQWSAKLSILSKWAHVAKYPEKRAGENLVAKTADFPALKSAATLADCTPRIGIESGVRVKMAVFF